MKKILITLFIIALSAIGYAQNSVGIGTTTPDPNAILDLQSSTNNQGLLVPRLTTAQRNAAAFLTALAGTSQGLVVYDTDLSSFQYWNGSAWNGLGGSDNDWIENNDTIYNNTHYVVVGQTSPLQEVKMLVVNNGLRSAFAGSSSGDGTDAIGVQGYAKSAPNLNIGVSGLAESSSATDTIVGTTGQAELGAGGWGIGVLGEVKNGSTGGYGVFGNAEGSGSGTMVGVYGTAMNGITNYAGYFNDGDVYIENNLGINQANAISRLHLGQNLHLDQVIAGGNDYNTYTFNLTFDGTEWVRTVAGTGVANYMGNVEYGIEIYGPGAAGSLATVQKAGFTIDTSRADIDIEGVNSEGLRLTSHSDRTLILNQPYDGSEPKMIFRNTIGDEVGVRPSGATTGSFDLTLPPNTGNPNEVLTTDGSGVLSWTGAAAADGNGIYGGSGTTPSNTNVTITDNINFGANTLYINETTSRVGIGTNSSVSALDVTGNTRLSGGKLFLGPVGGIDNGYTGVYEDSGDLKLAVFSAGAPATNFGSANSLDALTVKATTGHVGIGTSTPATGLHVINGVDASLANGTGHFIIGPETGANIVMDPNEIMARNNGVQSTLFMQNDGGDLIVHNDQGGGSQFIIQDDGKVGIGTLTPGTSKLYIDAGSHNFQAIFTRGRAIIGQVDHGAIINGVNRGSATNAIIIGEGANGQTGNMFELRSFGAASGDLMTINSAGDVGIGVAAPTAKLDVRGSLFFPNAGTPGANKVLTSDATGNATWQAVSAGTVSSIIDADGDTEINVEAAADQDVIHFSLGNSTGYPGAEYFTMIGPRLEVINSGRSVFLGELAGQNDDLGVNNNVFIGYQAGMTNIGGGNNTALGSGALSSSNSMYNTAVGYHALNANTNSGNSALGNNTLRNNTVGNSNTAMGYEAMIANINGNVNTAIGYEALLSNISGNSNAALGYRTLRSSTSDNNSAVGQGALRLTSTGGNNTALGFQAGDVNTIGIENTFIGAGANASTNALSNATAVGANTVVTASDRVKLGDNADVEFDGALLPNNLAGAPGDVLTSQGLAAAPIWTAPAGGAAAWELAGNTGTTAGTDFIGTTDAQDVVFKSNSNEYARLHIDGRFGIGDFSGLGALDLFEVRGAIGSGTFNHSDASQYSALQFAEANSVFGFIGQWGSTSATNPLDMQIGNFYSGGGGIKFSVNGAANLANPAMTIANDGNVGIGTDLPTTSLDVRGSGIFQEAVATPTSKLIMLPLAGGPRMYFGNDISQDEFMTFGAYAGANNIDIKNRDLMIYSTSAADALVVANTTGNVGIGTSVPGTDLEVIGRTRTDELEVTTGAGTAGNVLTDDGTGNAIWAPAGGADTDWTENASYVYNNTKQIVVGGTSTLGSYQMEIETTLPLGLMVDNNYTGAAQTTGYFADISNLGTGPKYGFFSTVRGNGAQTQPIYGIVNQVTSGNTETVYGIRNEISNVGGGTTYGTYNIGEDFNYYSGAIGIGTTTPSADLDVDGNVFIGSSGQFAKSGPDGPLHVFTSTFAFTPTLFLENEGGGNTGHGTGMMLSARSSIYKAGIAFDDNSSFGRGNLYFLNDGTADGSNADKSDARMTIQSNGNVGIGLTNPNELLTVEGVVSMRETSGVTNTINYGKFYADAGDQKPHFMASDGTDYDLTAGGADADWTISGADLYNTTHEVGIGTSTPAYLLDVFGNVGIGNDGQFTSYGFTGGIAPRFSYGFNTSASGGYGSIAVGYSATASGVASVALGQGVTASGYSSVALGWNSTASGDQGVAVGQGNTAAGTNSTAMGENMNVAAGAINSFGIALDNTGHSVTAANVMSIMGGNVGIGTIAPLGKLDITTSVDTRGSQIQNSTTSATNKYGLYSNSSGAGAGQNVGVWGDAFGTATGIKTGVGGQALGSGSEHRGIYGSALGGTVNWAGYFEQGNVYMQNNVGIGTTTPAHDLHVVGINTTTGQTSSAAGIAYVENQTTAGGVGILGATNLNNAAGAGNRTGVSGLGWYGQSSNYGLYGFGWGGNVAYGIYATVGNATTNWAGYFNGNVHVNGNLSKSGGSFLIDHPLDPENKYLYHSFVESPDMMNIYNGNIVTDANGDVTVTLPDYFDALNMEFRYQLTVMGTFAQAIISEKISGNQFKIKTDEPNVEVSWQVTGVRKDKYANQNRIVPEVEKLEHDKGKYLNPEVYGLPKERGIHYDSSRQQPKH